MFMLKPRHFLISARPMRAVQMSAMALPGIEARTQRRNQAGHATASSSVDQASRRRRSTRIGVQFVGVRTPEMFGRITDGARRINPRMFGQERFSPRPFTDKR